MAEFKMSSALLIIAISIAVFYTGFSYNQPIKLDTVTGFAVYDQAEEKSSTPIEGTGVEADFGQNSYSFIFTNENKWYTLDTDNVWKEVEGMGTLLEGVAKLSARGATVKINGMPLHEFKDKLTR